MYIYVHTCIYRLLQQANGTPMPPIGRLRALSHDKVNNNVLCK